MTEKYTQMVPSAITSSIATTLDTFDPEPDPEGDSEPPDGSIDRGSAATRQHPANADGASVALYDVSSRSPSVAEALRPSPFQ